MDARQLMLKIANISNPSLKADDDSYVDVDALKNELERVQPDYWGHIWHGVTPTRDPTNFFYVSRSTWPLNRLPNYASGSGYVLSRTALACVAPKIADGLYLPSEEMMMGIMVHSCNLKATDTKYIDVYGDGRVARWVIKHHVRNLTAVYLAGHSTPIPSKFSLNTTVILVALILGCSAWLLCIGKMLCRSRSAHCTGHRWQLVRQIDEQSDEEDGE